MWHCPFIGHFIAFSFSLHKSMHHCQKFGHAAVRTFSWEWLCQEMKSKISHDTVPLRVISKYHFVKTCINKIIPSTCHVSLACTCFTEVLLSFRGPTFTHFSHIKGTVQPEGFCKTLLRPERVWKWAWSPQSVTRWLTILSNSTWFWKV